jgi:hypothetical protein
MLGVLQKLFIAARFETRGESTLEEFPKLMSISVEGKRGNRRFLRAPGLLRLVEGSLKDISPLKVLEFLFHCVGPCLVCRIPIVLRGGVGTTGVSFPVGLLVLPFPILGTPG